jgi:hypothetical protein
MRTTLAQHVGVTVSYRGPRQPRPPCANASSITYRDHHHRNCARAGSPCRRGFAGRRQFFYARQPPPSATATARSVRILPGLCIAARPPPLQRLLQPTVQARDPQHRVSSRPPAWQTIPLPSADTTILQLHPVSYTRKVPLELAGTGLSLSPILPIQRHLSYLNDQLISKLPTSGPVRRKPEVSPG